MNTSETSAPDTTEATVSETTRGPTEAPAEVATAELDTQVGRLALACTSTGLVAVGWGSADDLAERIGFPVIQDTGWADEVLAAVRGYFDGRPEPVRVPLDWRLTGGTRQRVLRTLYETVPYGRSVTYGELAERSGTQVPARAIGGIMGSNPLPIVVPCHRVLAHDGLGGYSGGGRLDGLAVKRWLLAMEGVLPLTLGWSLRHGPGQV